VFVNFDPHSEFFVPNFFMVRIFFVHPFLLIVVPVVKVGFSVWFQFCEREYFLNILPNEKL
jgi:hypothetical protein